ncbi:MAG: SPOR domain-containing protein [bacterium]|nr:SPOR domain-containing protein [bacterium]
MSKPFIVILLCAASVIAQAVKKSPVDLMREGRLLEAQKIVEQTDAPERYHLLLDALREPNAIEACFLYREISARFPGSDCDEFAQERLLQAASMGIDISALVLESTPPAREGEWPVEESNLYEVERPLIASVSKDEPQAEATPVPVEPPVAKTVAEVAQEKTQQVVEKPAASSGVTLDYSAVPSAKPDSGVKAAALTPEKLLVRPEKIEQEVKAAKPVKKHGEPTKPHDVESVTPGEWYIQVGAFANHDNAHKFAARLRSDGYNVLLIPRDQLMQVRVGAYKTKEEGRAVGDKIKAKYDCPAVLVTNP